MSVPYRNPKLGNIETTRRILGRQTLGAMFGSVTDPRAYALAWVDSSQVKATGWAALSDAAERLCCSTIGIFRRSPD